MFVFYQCGEKVLLRHAKYMSRKSFKEIEIKIEGSVGAMYALTGDVLCFFRVRERISIFQPEQFRQSLSKQEIKALKRMGGEENGAR